MIIASNAELRQLDISLWIDLIGNVTVYAYRNTGIKNMQC
jgi:hypothetical protein